MSETSLTYCGPYDFSVTQLLHFGYVNLLPKVDSLWMMFMVQDGSTVLFLLNSDSDILMLHLKLELGGSGSVSPPCYRAGVNARLSFKLMGAGPTVVLCCCSPSASKFHVLHIQK